MNTKVISFAFAFIALILLIPASAAQAASPIGEFGWQSMLSDDLGVDVSCGAGNMKYELLIKDRETDSPVAVNSAWFAVANKVTYTLTGQMTGPGPIIGPLCFNPDTQVYGINIDGGAAYYDFQTYNVLSNPAAVTRGHHVRVTVWVTPTSATTPEYEQISPMNIYTNVSPVYKYNLSAFPSTYGATGVTTVEFFVVNHLTGVNVLTPTITLSGGVGIKTIPAQTLADGWYHWMFYQHLNGSHNPGVYTETKELSTGLATSNGSFILDTAPPTIDATTGHVPTNPYPTEQVTVTGSASDALAGITNIKVYVDAILVCNQDFAYKNTPSACSVAVGPYLGGTTHPYYAVATDGAGNITTSPIQNFTVSRTPVLTATTNALCGSGTIDLSWTPSAGATSYDIQRDGGTVFNVGNVTAFSDSGLVADSFHSYRVRAVQGRGPSGWSESTEAVVASSCVSNVPPVASAGSNKAMTLPTNSVTISGASASDPDGSVVSTIWSKVSGPNVPTITGGTTLSPTFSGLIVGTYIFRLTATDNLGATGFDEMQVVVSQANIAPTANAGVNRAITLPTNSVIIAGASASDPDGSVVSTIWSKVSGPNVPTITGGTTLSPTFSGLIVGTYIFNLAVTDNSGQVTNSTMTITVSNPADPTMTVNTPPSPIPSGTPFTLSMTTSGATNVTWSRSDNGSPDWTNQPLGALFYNYGPTSWAGSMIDHTYVWTFTAYNAIGVQVSKTITLKILAAVPKLTVFPSSALFTSAPVGNTTTYNFSVANTGAAGSVLTGTASSDDPAHFYCVSCTYTIPKGASPVTITFTFKATAPLGTYNGILTFTNDQKPSDNKTVPVQGESISPIVYSMAGTPAALNFGKVPTVRTKDITFTVKNISAVNFGSVALTGLPAGFTCTSGCTLNLANNIVNTVTIRFAPTVVGLYGLAADPSSKVYPGALSDYYFTVTGEGVASIFNVKEE